MYSSNKLYTEKLARYCNSVSAVRKWKSIPFYGKPKKLVFEEKRFCIVPTL